MPKLVEYASPSLPEGFSLGNLDARKNLRAKLNCKSFSWYLQHVTPNMYVPEVRGLLAGALRNPATGGCLDTLMSKNPGLYPCHGQHGTQAFAVDGEGFMRLPLMMYEQCVAIKKGGGGLSVIACPRKHVSGDKFSDARWELQASGRMASVSGQCLRASRKSSTQSPLTVTLVACENGVADTSDQWTWDHW